MDKLISVVVPVYNTELVLSRCVSSLLNQTYEHLEILLIDDGSTDNSGTICDEYARKDDRISVFHTSNFGAAHARNTGIEKAKGRFVTFVDSDDYVDNTIIEVLENDITTNDSDLSISSLQEEEFHDFCINISSENEEEIMFLSERYLIFGPTQKMYRTEIVKQIRFPENIKYGEDLLFNLEYLKRIKSISYVNKKLYYYCRTDDGLSAKNRWDMFENDIVLHKALSEWYESIGIFNDKEKSFLYDRVIGTAINSICQTFKKDYPFGFFETQQLIKNIVNNDMVRESLKYVDIDKYAKWQVYLVKHKKAFLLSVVAWLERIIHD